MDAVEAASATHAPDEARKPVGLVLLGYLATLLMPTIGFLFGLVALSRPDRWAKRQGVLILVLAGVLVTFGIALLPMVTESYFADKANSELRVVSEQTKHEEEESDRRFHAEMARLHSEEAATDARIKELKARGGR